MRLHELLAAEGLISAGGLLRVDEECRRTNGRFVRLLLDLGLVAERELAAFLAKRCHVPALALARQAIDAAVVALVPAPLARKHDVVPVEREGRALTVAMSDPTDLSAIDDIAFRTGLSVRPAVATRTEIRDAIDRLYCADAPVPAAPAPPEVSRDDFLTDVETEIGRLQVLQGSADDRAVSLIELKASAGEAPIVNMVNRILVDAISRGASDVHIEPNETTLRVRLRIDGVLYETLALPRRLEPAVMSRLKIMASCNIAERRVPQDGRIRLRYRGRDVDVRLSLLPTVFGEKALVRVLDRAGTRLSLRSLGFDDWSLQRFRAAITQPHGMVLITGPTGSGKTTSLYAAIETINSPDIHIVTAEDPVEYNIKGINQVQINEAVGRTFAATLRSFLRQDPDVILVGETRDAETAQISVRAALTGHLVFSTLHTNDAPSTVARLREMGIAPFLIASSLLLVVSQRLVRRVCDGCRHPYEVSADELASHGHIPELSDIVTLYRGKGCGACHDTGFKGRVGIYEVMEVSETLRDMISRGAPTSEMRAHAQSQGMRTLRHAGLEQVIAGVTTLDEVLRVTLA